MLKGTGYPSSLIVYFLAKNKPLRFFEISRRFSNETCSNFESSLGYHFPIDSRGNFALTPILHPQIAKIGQNFDQNHRFWYIFGIWSSPWCLMLDIDPKPSEIAFKLCLGS
jgi:hypothetical protein